MKFLLIGGQPDSGKSETIYRIFMRYSISYTQISNLHPHAQIPSGFPFEDFSVLLEGLNNKGNLVKILIHSPTDDSYNINMLKNNIISHSPDIIICSIRDIDWQRQMVLDIVANNYHFEIPLARITRRHNSRPIALDWYRSTIDILIDSVLVQTPFSL